MIIYASHTERLIGQSQASTRCRSRPDRREPKTAVYLFKPPALPAERKHAGLRAPLLRFGRGLCSPIRCALPCCHTSTSNVANKKFLDVSSVCERFPTVQRRVLCQVGFKVLRVTCRCKSHELPVHTATDLSGAEFFFEIFLKERPDQDHRTGYFLKQTVSRCFLGVGIGCSKADLHD